MNPFDVIDQRYRLEQRIGVGGMAEVWLAEDTRLGRQVAVKILSGHLDDIDQSIITSIENEARLVARLQHPNIVAVYDTGTVGDRSYLVMEYVDGRSVRELLERDGRFSEADTRRYGAQVAAALHYAHQQGVIHCDVKPENILISRDGVAKVTDFGVADKVTRTLTPAQAREILGTIAYLAPEVLQGLPSTPASDTYSLGLTLYEMLAGRLPFEGATPAQVAAQRLANPAPPLSSYLPGASPALSSALASALAIRPESRPATTEEFRQLFSTRARTTTTPAAAPLPPAVALPPRPPRHRTTARVQRMEPPRSGGANTALIVATIGVVALGIGAAVLALALLGGNGDGEPNEPTPAPSPSVAPTETVEPTEEPTATPTNEPTLTPTPEETPTPTQEPTETPTPTEEAGQPTATPTPPDAPLPSPTP